MARERTAGLLLDLIDERSDPAPGDGGPDLFDEPKLEPLLGCQVWTCQAVPPRGRPHPKHRPGDPECPVPAYWEGYRSGLAASEETPEPGEVCPTCGAVRDRSGAVLVLDLVGPEGEPVQVRTGVREGDRFVCLTCRCVAPANERRVRRSRPRPTTQGRSPRPPRLTKKDRQELAETPEGRAYLVLHDAQARGDDATASRVRLAFHLHHELLIKASELADRAEEIAAETAESKERP